MEAIEFESGFPDKGRPHKSYLRRRDGGSWYAVSENGTPNAMSTYSQYGTRMSIELDRTATAEEALEIFKEYAYSRFAADARVI